MRRPTAPAQRMLLLPVWYIVMWDRVVSNVCIIIIVFCGEKQYIIVVVRDIFQLILSLYGVVQFFINLYQNVGHWPKNNAAPV